MKYSCPMHPEGNSDKPGRCKICGMKLVTKDEMLVKKETDIDFAEGSLLSKYKPLLVIFGLLLLTTMTIAIKDYYLQKFSIEISMMNFMAGFCLTFAGFKLLNLEGFAQGYSTYDLLAKRFFGYGYIYPFIELLLGLLLIIRFQPDIVNIITILIFSFSGIGVLNSLLRKQKFECVCLGTIFKLPLTKVTLIEDFGMVFLGVIAIAS